MFLGSGLWREAHVGYDEVERMALLACSDKRLQRLVCRVRKSDHCPEAVQHARLVAFPRRAIVHPQDLRALKQGAFSFGAQKRTLAIAFGNLDAPAPAHPGLCYRGIKSGPATNGNVEAKYFEPRKTPYYRKHHVACPDDDVGE